MAQLIKLISPIATCVSFNFMSSFEVPDKQQQERGTGHQTDHEIGKQLSALKHKFVQ